MSDDYTENKPKNTESVLQTLLNKQKNSNQNNTNDNNPLFSAMNSYIPSEDKLSTAFLKQLKSIRTYDTHTPSHIIENNLNLPFCLFEEDKVQTYSSSLETHPLLNEILNNSQKSTRPLLIFHTKSGNTLYTNQIAMSELKISIDNPKFPTTRELFCFSIPTFEEMYFQTRSLPIGMNSKIFHNIEITLSNCERQDADILFTISNEDSQVVILELHLYNYQQYRNEKNIPKLLNNIKEQHQQIYALMDLSEKHTFLLNIKEKSLTSTKKIANKYNHPQTVTNYPHQLQVDKYVHQDDIPLYYEFVSIAFSGKAGSKIIRFISPTGDYVSKKLSWFNQIGDIVICYLESP